MNQQSQPSGGVNFGGAMDDDSEGATQMVDLNALGPGGMPPSSPPPGGGMGGGMVVGGGADFDDGATQMVDLNAFGAGAGTPAPAPAGGGMVVGGGGFDDGATQMVDLNAFKLDQIDNSGPTYSEGGEATQFVNLAALAAGPPDAAPAMPSGPTPIEQDPVLLQSYQFGPDSIQNLPGDITLVFARNSFGHDVVLKRVFNGPPEHMPDELRTLVQNLQTVKHPNLATMNGLFAGQSGCWVELQRPPGGRLTHMLMSGGLPLETVAPWFINMADALATVHSFSILYNTLTTDAVWVEPNTGQVTLEPFNALAFEDRGNLGPFGAPEMNTPIQQRPQTPATDVYSFAITLLAAVGGLPPGPHALEGLPKGLQAAVQAAINPDMNARPTDFEALKAALAGGGGKGAGAAPDPKLIGGVAAILGVVVVGVVLMGDSGGPPTEPPPNTPNNTTAAVANTTTSKPAETNNQPPALAAAPGTVQEDGRLKVKTAYRMNPVSTDEKKVEFDSGKAQKAREQARTLLKEAPKLKPQFREKNYEEALRLYAESIKYDPKNPDNEVLQGEMTENSRLREYVDRVVGKVEANLTSGTVSSARLSYQKMARMYPGATYVLFFEQNGRAPVQKLTRAK